MAVLEAQATPEELIDFLKDIGVEGIDIDAMEIMHNSSHVFKRGFKTYYVMVLYTDGYYKKYIETALKKNNRDFKWK